MRRRRAAALVHRRRMMPDRLGEADEDRLADRKWPMLSSTTCGSAATRRAVS